MNSYKILNKQVYSQGEYSLVPIRIEDRFEIMKWRNEQIYHLRQAEPLTVEMQNNYFENVVSKLFAQEKPSQLLFSYLENDKCIGYGGLVHINWLDKNAEISFIMDTSLEEREFSKHWSIYLDLLEQLAFEELKLHKLFTYAFDLRPHLYNALETNGFIHEASLKDHCLFHDEFKNVVIHSKIRYAINVRNVTLGDKQIIFEWANDELVRSNSFNFDPILYNDHSIWFEKKMNDENAFYYICEVDGTPAGLVRFDKNENNTVRGISIDKKFRGRKLASKFLIKCCETYTELSDNIITAFIKKENVGSVRSFENAGFVFQRELKINKMDSYEYVFSKK